MRLHIFILIILIVWLSPSISLANNECYSFIDEDNYIKALVNGLQILNKIPNSYYYNYCAGLSYYKLGDYKEALKYIAQAKKYAISKDEIAGCYNTEGLIYQDLKDYNKSLTYYLKALKIAKDIFDKKGIVNIYSNIASLYESMGRYDQALNGYKQILSVMKGKDKAIIYNNISNLYYYEGDYLKSLEYIKKAIAIDDKFQNYPLLATHYINAGEIYISMNKLNTAKDYLYQGIAMETLYGDKIWLKNAYISLGFIYHKQAINILKEQKNQDTAYKYLKIAYDFYSLSSRKDLADIVRIEYALFSKSRNNNIDTTKIKYYQEALKGSENAIYYVMQHNPEVLPKLILENQNIIKIITKNPTLKRLLEKDIEFQKAI